MDTKDELKNFDFSECENIKVENMTSDSSGREIPNQFLIRTDKGIYFQSYKSIIAFKPHGEEKIILGTDWAYSVTTGKYRNQFLCETREETHENIKKGVYIVNPNW